MTKKQTNYDSTYFSEEIISKLCVPIFNNRSVMELLVLPYQERKDIHLSYEQFIPIKM